MKRNFIYTFRVTWSKLYLPLINIWSMIYSNIRLIYIQYSIIYNNKINCSDIHIILQVITTFSNFMHMWKCVQQQLLIFNVSLHFTLKILYIHTQLLHCFLKKRYLLYTQSHMSYIHPCLYLQNKDQVHGAKLKMVQQCY